MADRPAPPEPVSPLALLEVASVAAAAAARLIHHERPEVLSVSEKSSATDHVTHMDRDAEALLRRIIAEHRPDDAVVGEEEEEATAGRSGVTWWLDPIDGTTNYVYDHPGYAVSVAAGVVVHDDAAATFVTAAGPDGAELRVRVLAGVVADPTHARTYSAARGHGARCDGRRLHLGEDPPPLERMLVATGFSYDASRRRDQGRVVAELLPAVRDIRRSGAAALDLCSVAAGRVDAYYEAGLAPWDLAAGALIAAEAGAVVTDLHGGVPRVGSVLACHPQRGAELRALLADCGA